MVEAASRTTPWPSAWRWSAKASSACRLHLPVPPVTPVSLTPRSRLIRVAARWTRSWSAVVSPANQIALWTISVVGTTRERRCHVVAEIALPRGLGQDASPVRGSIGSTAPRAVGDLAVEVDVVDVEAGVALGEIGAGLVDPPLAIGRVADVGGVLRALAARAARREVELVAGGIVQDPTGCWVSTLLPGTR